MRKAKNVLMMLLLCLVIGGLTTFLSSVGDAEFGPIHYNTAYGYGPAGIEYVETMNDGMGNWLVTVFFGPGEALLVADSPEFQLRVFMDAPGVDQNLYFTAGNAVLVTPTFDMIEPAIPYYIDPAMDSITFTVPFPAAEMTGLASLAMDIDPIYFHTTTQPGLNFLGYEISRSCFAPDCFLTSNEIFMTETPSDQTADPQEPQDPQEKEVDESDNKVWPIPDDRIDPDAEPNPLGDHGPLYKGWPKTVGNTTFWEYSGEGGFIKRVHVDTNGNGEIDEGEPHGYVGGCPYDPGYNTQSMNEGGTTWISEWGGNGQRIVHELKKIIGEDGTEQWVVVSTHQTQQDDGTWTDTPVSPPHQNPITNPPYQDPSQIPTNSSFGL